MLNPLMISKKLTHFTCFVKNSSKKIDAFKKRLSQCIVGIVFVFYIISAESPASNNLLQRGFKSS